MDDWINSHGTDALKRAAAEGYDTRKGVADLLVERVTAACGLKMVPQWLDSEERTSPSAQSFAYRDRVADAVKTIRETLPEGWSLEVSKIQRVQGNNLKKFTGVTLDVNEHRRIIRRVVFSFE